MTSAATSCYSHEMVSIAPQESHGAGPGTAIGIDLGGTKVRAALADSAGRIVEEEVQPTDLRSGEALIDQIARIALGWSRAGLLGSGGLSAAGMAVAGVPDPSTGSVGMAPNLPGVDRLNVRAALSRALGCEVLLENDVNAAALGEQWLGCGRGVANFAFVAVGTGIGMGLVTDGRLLRGARGAAGEIAWLPIGSDPQDLRAGRHGRLEAAIGSHAMVERYRALGGAGAVDARTLFTRLRQGDSVAETVVDEVAARLAEAFLAIAAVADPERIVLGGTIGVQPELVERVTSLSARAPREMPRIAVSELGTRAGVLGAVRLALTAG